MSATSDVLPPQPKGLPTRVNDDTNPPRGGIDHTMPNYGGLPESLTQLSTRMFAFRPSPHAGDIGLLGRYRLVKQLGKGGMGAVYLGFDERLRRRVAIKVMNPDVSFDPESKERFLREARAVAQITHDNVIDIFDADEADGIPYIAMQYLQGSPLDQYLTKKGLPSIPQVIRIGREVANGLAAAHRLDLVHRDIKPGNIWLEAPNGRVKILDFGLARPVKGEGEITKSGAVVGTPAYMPPEQARGHKVDYRADLFSLGVVLYRLVTGRLPFDGPDMMAMLTALAVEDPAPVWSINPEVPQGLGELIHQLLAKKPEHRPQTADEVSARLNSLSERSAASTNPSASGHIVYVPMPVTVQTSESNAFAELLDEATEVDKKASFTGTRRMIPPRTSSRGMQISLMLGGLVTMLVGGFYIIKIVNSDGTTSEIKVPDTAHVSVDKNGKKVFDSGKKHEQVFTGPINYAPFTKLEPNWQKTVSALPHTDILGPINEELKRRNPGYDGKGLQWLQDPKTGVASLLEVRADEITDLMPLLALPDLQALQLINGPKSSAQNGSASQLSSLVPLQGLRKLRTLILVGHPKLTDLAPLENLPLEELTVGYCGVESIAPLAKLPIERLSLRGSPIRDFSPLAKLPLESLDFGCANLSVDLSPLENLPLREVMILSSGGLDLTPLKKCPLKSFGMTLTALPDLSPLEGSDLEVFAGFDYVQYEAFVRTLPKIKTIASYTSGGISSEDYFRMCEQYHATNREYKERVAKLPLDARIAAARAQFTKQNDGKKSVLEVEVQDGEVVAASICGSDFYSSVWNLTFLHAFPKLKRFDARGLGYQPLFHQVTDLPIEEIQVNRTNGNIAKNLYSFARMKSLKKVNDMTIQELEAQWNLYPARKKTVQADVPKIDPDWVMKVSAMPSAEALAEVNAELKRRNPNFTENVEQLPEQRNATSPTHVRVVSPNLRDLSPLLGLPNLVHLSVSGGGSTRSILKDIRPLAGFKKLRSLELRIHGQLTDLSPLQGMSLTNLNLYATNVSNLAPLRGMPLTDLNIHKSPVRDLDPLRGLPLKSLWLGHPDLVQDLSGLAGSSVQHLVLHDARGMDLSPLKKCSLLSLMMQYCSQPDLSPLEGSGLETLGGHNMVEHTAFMKTLPKLRWVYQYGAGKSYSKEQIIAMAEEREKATQAFIQESKKLTELERVQAAEKQFDKLAKGQKYELRFSYDESNSVTSAMITGEGQGADIWDFSYLRIFPKIRRLNIDVQGEEPNLHQVVNLPIEELFLKETTWGVLLNQRPLAQMKSLKRVNDRPFEEFAKERNLFPTAKASNPTR